MSHLEPKSEHEAKKRIFPIVTDFNPGLPNIGAILSRHKYILSLDSDLGKLLKTDNIFASYRGTKTIKDIIIHSKPVTNNNEVS